MRWVRLAPVTAEISMISVALFISCILQAMLDSERIETVQRNWGAVRQLELVEFHDGVRQASLTELRGPFDVWDGSWWRIPLTPFHHSSLLHLVVVVVPLIYLGQFLEAYWGSFRLLIFVIPGLILPVLGELAFGYAHSGMSGVACAMLGAVAVIRSKDVERLPHLQIGIVEAGFGFLIAGWLLAAIGSLSLSVFAQFIGLAYGAIAAVALEYRGYGKSLIRICFGLVFLVQLYGMVKISEPQWVGRFHWYRSIRNRNPQASDRELERAIQIDSGLTGAWLRWSQNAELQGDLTTAWNRTVRGLAENPSNPALIDAARRLWRHLDVTQRVQAESDLRKYFGKQFQVWLAQMRSEVFSGEDLNANSSEITRDDEQDLSKYSLDRKLVLPTIPAIPVRPLEHRRIQPIIENDAAVGETL